MAFISGSGGYRENQAPVRAALIGAVFICLAGLVCFQLSLELMSSRLQTTIKGFAVLESPQFAIAGEAMQLHLRLHPDVSQPVTVELGADVLANYDVGTVVPMPSVMTPSGGKTRIVFDPLGERASTISVSLIPKTWGSHSASVRVLFGTAAVAETAFAQWVLP